MAFTLARRIEVEKILVRAYLDAAVKHGWRPYHTSTGGDDNGYVTNTVDAVMRYVNEGDDAIVSVRKGSGKGWFSFVYGNEGWTVLHDYTVNLSAIVDSCDALVEEFEREDSQ